MGVEPRPDRRQLERLLAQGQDRRRGEPEGGGRRGSNTRRALLAALASARFDSRALTTPQPHCKDVYTHRLLPRHDLDSMTRRVVVVGRCSPSIDAARVDPLLCFSLFFFVAVCLFVRVFEVLPDSSTLADVQQLAASLCGFKRGLTLMHKSAPFKDEASWRARLKAWNEGTSNRRRAKVRWSGEEGGREGRAGVARARRGGRSSSRQRPPRQRPPAPRRRAVVTLPSLGFLGSRRPRSRSLQV